MNKGLLKANYFYILWSLMLIIFLVIILNQYCKMYYGGNLLYISSGKNKITNEEKNYLKKRGSLIYGEKLDSFPAQIYDESLKSENGFHIDLMNQLAWEMETNIIFQPLLWSSAFEKLENGEVDILQISYSPERAEKYYLSSPIYKSKGVVFIKNDGEEIQRLADLAGKKLAGVKNDYALLVLKEKVPSVEILEYNNIAECAEELNLQNVDGIISDEQDIMYYVQQEKLFQQYYIVKEEVYKANVVFAVRKTDEQLGKIIDKAVYHLRTKDTLEKIQQKWFLTSVLEDAIPPQNLYFLIFEFLIGTFLFFLYLFYYIHNRTKLLIEIRTSELNQEKQKIKTILDSIPQYLLEVNLTGKIQMMNQQVKKDLPLKIIPFCDNETLTISEKSILELLEEISEMGYIQKEFEIEQRWFRITGSGISGINEMKNIILLFEDITIARFQEKRNIQNEKMVAIGQLASGVSHELKNPLEIICNYCYAFKKGIFRTEEDILDTINVIEEEAKDANKIVENLLSFARTTDPEINETEINSCIQMILNIQIPLLRKKEIEVQFQCIEKIFVQCNPESIKKIIINLLTNSADALEEIKYKLIKIETTKYDSYAEITFQDNGKGMNEQEQEKIFNPFYTTKSKGTGLGLYLVYQEIEKSNGSIEVYSRKGKGTLFRIHLQLKDNR